MVRLIRWLKMGQRVSSLMVSSLYLTCRTDQTKTHKDMP